MYLWSYLYHLCAAPVLFAFMYFLGSAENGNGIQFCARTTHTVNKILIRGTGKTDTSNVGPDLYPPRKGHSTASAFDPFREVG